MTLWAGEPDDGSRPDEFAVAQLPDAEGPRAFVVALRDAALATDARTGIPAGFIVAQAALESGWGRSVPKDIETGRYSHNLFGIKALDGQDAVTAWTWEYQGGQWVRVQARFRAYSGYQESLDDHARLLTSPRYARCLPATDVAAYARCIQAAGYATDPRYADKIIGIMRTWRLLDLRGAPQPPACRVVVEGAGMEVVVTDGQIIDGRAWAPVRQVTEALGARVAWDAGSRTVRISRP